MPSDDLRMVDYERESGIEGLEGLSANIDLRITECFRGPLARACCSDRQWL